MFSIDFFKGRNCIQFYHITTNQVLLHFIFLIYCSAFQNKIGLIAIQKLVIIIIFFSFVKAGLSQLLYLVLMYCALLLYIFNTNSVRGTTLNVLI